jgi:hypothetical protein
MDTNLELSGGSLVIGSDRRFMLNSFLDMATVFTESTVRIRGTWIDNNLVDSWCFGNTNAKEYQIKLYDEFGNLLFDTGSQHIITQPVNFRIITHSGKALVTQSFFSFKKIDNQAIFIETLKDDIFNVREFELILRADDPLFIGNLFVGLKTQLPRPGVSINNDVQLFSESIVSYGGHVHGSLGVYTEGFSCDFPILTAEDRKIMRRYLVDVQDVIPHYVDPFWGSREEFEPIYGTLSESNLSLQKLTNPDGAYYSTSLKWRGSR